MKKASPGERGWSIVPTDKHTLSLVGSGIAAVIAAYKFALPIQPLFALSVLFFLWSLILWRKLGSTFFYSVFVLCIMLALLPAIIRGWPKSIKPASDSELLIVVCEFEDRGTLALDLRTRIIESIKSQITKTHNLDVRCESWNAINEAEEADDLAQSTHATLVLWGWYDDAGITSRYTLTVGKAFKEAYSDYLMEVPSESPIYLQIIRNDLPQQLTILSLFTLGIANYLHDRATEAESVFRATISYLRQTKPSSFAQGDSSIVGLPYYFLGLSMAQNRAKPSHVMHCFDAAIRAGLKRPGLYSNRAALNIILNRPDEALDDCNSAISFDSLYYRAYYHRGLVNAKLRRFSDAERDWRKTLDLDSNNVRALTNLGILYFRLRGRYEEAQKWLTRALSVEATHYKALFYRSAVRIILRDAIGAIQDLEECRLQYPPDGEVAINKMLECVRMPECEKVLRDSLMTIRDSSFSLELKYYR